MLPCLHRYCKDCLHKVIQGQHDTFTCPLCKQTCDIPEEGIDGFKTDFHMKSLLQFIQLQKSFDAKEVKKCVGCSQVKKVVAYCFRCKDFLCSNCYDFHLNNPMVREHKDHTLDLQNVKSRNLSLERLASLNEIPRCHDHAENPAQLCCCTCGNLPVCVACTYGKHRGHDLHEVSTLAKTEREKLTAKLASLDVYRNKLYDLPKEIAKTKESLKGNVVQKKVTLKAQHEQQGLKLKARINTNDTKFQKQKADLENKKKTEGDIMRLQMEQELHQVRERFENLIRDKEEEYDSEIEACKRAHDVNSDRLFKKLGALDSNAKSWYQIINTQEEGNESHLEAISERVDHIIKRYENFKASASAILASKDDWTDVQCLPDVCAASEPLIKEANIDFPELKSLSDFATNDLPSIDHVTVTITESEESVVNVEGVKAKEWWNKGIASSGDGNIVITGRASTEYSYIAVINTDGKTVRQGKIKKAEGSTFYPYRHCAPLSAFKVVTVCESNLIGIYDVQNVMYNEKKIMEVIHNWPAGRYVTCVTADPNKNLIFVGNDSKEIHILDQHLTYLRKLILPDEIERPRALAVHGNSLLVCDYAGGKAYAVSLEELHAKVLYELAYPEDEARPWSVCTDKNGFIYVIRDDPTTHHRRKILVQYSQDGRHLLTKKVVDGDTRCVTVLNNNEVEKLLIITETSGKLYTFGLLSNEE